MTDLSTLTGQTQHYAPIRARLWGEPETVKRITIPALAASRPRASIPKAACQPIARERYTDHPEFGNGASRWRQIVKDACIKHDVSIAMVMGDSRRIDVIPIRHECFYRVHTETTMSKKQIGVKFGRDHTSITHGIRRHIFRAAAAGIVLAERPYDKGKLTVENVRQLHAEGLTNAQIASRMHRCRNYVASIVSVLDKVAQLGAGE